LWVAVGQDYDFGAPGWRGAIKTSPDGTNWTQRYLGGQRLNDIVYAEGKLTVVGHGGAIFSSTNGIDWQPENSGTVNHLESIAYGNGYFVAVGDSDPNSVLTSPDGETWTDYGGALPSWQSMTDIDYLSDRFVANGWYSNHRSSTNNGISFDYENLSETYRAPAMAFGNGYYFSGGVIQGGDRADEDVNLISLKGTEWYEIVTPSQDNREAAIFYNHRFITVGANGSIWISPEIVASSVRPTIDILTFPTTVTYDVATVDISGTNNAGVVGTMSWTNVATGGGGEFGVQSSEFVISNISLAVGDNIITVSGTNVLGVATNDSVTMTRETRYPNEPAWWYRRGVLNGEESSDYNLANLGQLKGTATQAYEEFEAKLPGGAGSNVTALVLDFVNSNNYEAINVGQLKNVIQSFYDRLWELGMTNAYPAGVTNQYPWQLSTNAPSDYSAANLGQLKYLFSFDLTREKE